MAGKKENLKSLFSNTRTRVIILATLIVLLLAVLIGYFKFKSNTVLPNEGTRLSNAPGLESIPGSLNPTPLYAKLQETQNINQAAEALKTGKSAIPTLVRTQAIGEGVGIIGSPEGKGGLGFKTLADTQSQGNQQSLWLQTLKDAGCTPEASKTFVDQGGRFKDLKLGCTCTQLKNNGYNLRDLKSICDCKELKAAGYLAKDLKDIGFTAQALRSCGYNACDQRNAGFSAQEMKDAGFSDGELKGSGFSDDDIAKTSGLPANMTPNDVRKAGCTPAALAKLRQAGVTAQAIRRISGCSAEQLKAAGYTAKELKDAGFSAADLTKAGFSPDEIKGAGYNTKELEDAGIIPASSLAQKKVADCSPESLKKARADGVSALTIKQTLGCSAKALRDAGYSARELMNAGFSAAELLNAGFTPNELKEAGFSAKDLYLAGVPLETLKNLGYSLNDLKDAGISAADLKKLGFTAAQLKAAGFDAKALKDAGFSAEDLAKAGFSAKELKEAGFSAEALKQAGFSAKDLRDAGFSAGELKNAGFSANELKNAGFSPNELANAGFSPSELGNAGFAPGQTQLAGLRGVSVSQGAQGPQDAAASRALEAQDAENRRRQLDALLAKQNQQLAEQKNQQQIQQKTTTMLGAANQAVQDWKKVTIQTYVPGSEEKAVARGANLAAIAPAMIPPGGPIPPGPGPLAAGPPADIKTGDVVFAVLDTSVNSDEPGPILATVVSGKLKGSKLIGSFNLPPNANKMIISFNTLSRPGAPKSMSIAAFAIDPNTARTALSSRTNHHYLMRYGSLFASSFLEGFGNAFQASNTSITIGGTGGGNNITVQSGIGQSALENAVIGLATVGKMWGQQAQLLMNTPTTVLVCAGTGIGVMFTQDVTLI